MGRHTQPLVLARPPLPLSSHLGLAYNALTPIQPSPRTLSPQTTTNATWRDDLCVFSKPALLSLRTSRRFSWRVPVKVDQISVNAKRNRHEDSTYPLRLSLPLPLHQNDAEFWTNPATKEPVWK